MRPFLFVVATTLLLISTSHGLSQSGENIAFAVQAEDGLELVISGYNAKGRVVFQETTRTRESYNGRYHYIVRVPEEVIQNTKLKEWCAEDLTEQWAVLPIDGPRVTCDNRPRENRGTYTFISRTFPGSNTGIGTDAAAILCVQRQLNRLGFDAGATDGIIGGQTFRAAESYIRFMKAGAGGPGWNQPDLSVSNAAHWCEKVAEAHPRAARFYQAYLDR